MTSADRKIKRAFDVIFSALALVFAFPIIFIAWSIACVDTRASGFFLQTRIGQHGSEFKVIKIRTMIPSCNASTVTISGDPRITPWGRFFRRYKIDELPQLFNIILGQMSFVGPRPDVPGFADKLEGSDRDFLLLKPGITGPATLKYRNEEYILSLQANPIAYNKEVVWPDKVRIGLAYLDNWSLWGDCLYILRTLF